MCLKTNSWINQLAEVFQACFTHTEAKNQHIQLQNQHRRVCSVCALFQLQTQQDCVYTRSCYIATVLHYEQCKDSALLSIYKTGQDRTKQFDSVLQCKTASGTDGNISAGLTQTIANYSIKGRRRAEEEAGRTNMVGHAEENCLCIKHFKNTRLL